ncbi:hypothetical protein M446_6651 [Methylobacterium sp. 4-46]|nr:hypothetical protein M446_6651 [Methylobacterium sp. 4-46]
MQAFLFALALVALLVALGVLARHADHAASAARRDPSGR